MTLPGGTVTPSCTIVQPMSSSEHRWIWLSFAPAGSGPTVVDADAAAGNRAAARRRVGRSETFMRPSLVGHLSCVVVRKDGQASSLMTTLASRFAFSERQTSLRTEVLGGAATFLTMSYIVFVN